MLFFAEIKARGKGGKSRFFAVFKKNLRNERKIFTESLEINAKIC